MAGMPAISAASTIAWAESSDQNSNAVTAHFPARAAARISFIGTINFHLAYFSLWFLSLQFLSVLDQFFQFVRDHMADHQVKIFDHDHLVARNDDTKVRCGSRLPSGKSG
jgi:hypothetical protein